jgi:dTDP-4-amino-4,6-dideoxygalactose transaminase
MSDRIYLSSPHLGEMEREYVQEAFDTNWVAPLGPNVDAFEAEFCDLVGCRHAAALASGTSALHLALILSDVGPGDEVWVSDLTFVASVNPIRYVGATPVLVDAERESWNIDPDLLAEGLEEAAAKGALPKALIVVHLYGQPANLDPIVDLCDRYDITLIEDAAEALGAEYRGSAPGTLGKFGIFSFNGNKIITTSGGGMLVSDDEEAIAHARKLATQARDPAPHYQHTEIGFNYRLSNVCAGIGRGQLQVLAKRVEQRRANFDFYVDRLGDLPGVTFQPEASWAKHTRWLTVCLIDPDEAGVDTTTVREVLAEDAIEARPLWKPMHLQPLYEECRMIGGSVGEELFAKGLCLPSGSNMTDDERERVVAQFRKAFQ